MNEAVEASLLQFPCAFPLKVMGRATADFEATLVALVQDHDPGFDPACVERRPSRGGTYLGLTLTITATSRSQLDTLYRALSAHPMVKVVL